MVETYTIKGLGYLRGYRSLKDYYPDNPKVKKEIEKVPKLNTTLSKIELSAPKNIDRRTQFTPIRDQGSLGSCTCIFYIWNSRILRKECIWFLYVTIN